MSSPITQNGHPMQYKATDVNEYMKDHIKAIALLPCCQILHMVLQNKEKFELGNNAMWQKCFCLCTNIV